MTLIIIAITFVISLLAFRDRSVMNKLMFNAHQIWHKREWYRMITNGFVHADWLHLIINMVVFYSFGISVEKILFVLEENDWIEYPVFIYFALYLSAIIVSSLLSLIKHRDNLYYNSVGASGAVSSIVFFSIFFDPWRYLYLYGVVEVRAIVLGGIYLVYSYYMGRKGQGFINHDAHFVGAVYGLLFPVLLDFNLLEVFLSGLLK